MSLCRRLEQEQSGKKKKKKPGRTQHETLTDKLNFIKVKNFCSKKDNIKRIGRQATDWGKYCKRHI